MPTQSQQVRQVLAFSNFSSRSPSSFQRHAQGVCRRPPPEIFENFISDPSGPGLTWLIFPLPEGDFFCPGGTDSVSRLSGLPVPPLFLPPLPKLPQILCVFLCICSNPPTPLLRRSPGFGPHHWSAYNNCVIWAVVPDF